MRIGGGGVYIAGKAAAHIEIEQNIEGIVEWPRGESPIDPRLIRHQVSSGDGAIDVGDAIHIELNLVRAPDNAEDMVTAPAGCAVRLVAQALIRVGLAMQRSINKVRIAANVLHDVEFAAAGPVD